MQVPMRRAAAPARSISVSSTWLSSVIRFCRVDFFLPSSSRPRFEDHVEWRLRGAADVAEAACGGDLAQFGLARLSLRASSLIDDPLVAEMDARKLGVRVHKVG